MLQSNLSRASTRRLDTQRLKPRGHAERAAGNEGDADAPVPRRQVRAVHLFADILPVAAVAAHGEAVEVAVARRHAKMHDGTAAPAFRLIRQKRRLVLLLAPEEDAPAAAHGDAERVISVPVRR